MVAKVTKHSSDTPVDILLVTRSPAIDGLIYSNIGDLMLVDHGRTITIHIHIHHVYLVGGPHEADDGPLVGVLGLAVDDGQLVLVVHLLLVRAWARVSQCRVAVSRVTCHVSRVTCHVSRSGLLISRANCGTRVTADILVHGRVVESENCVQKPYVAQGRRKNRRLCLVTMKISKNVKFNQRVK